MVYVYPMLSCGTAFNSRAGGCSFTLDLPLCICPRFASWTTDFEMLLNNIITCSKIVLMLTAILSLTVWDLSLWTHAVWIRLFRFDALAIALSGAASARCRTTRPVLPAAPSRRGLFDENWHWWRCWHRAHPIIAENHVEDQVRGAAQVGQSLRPSRDQMNAKFKLHLRQKAVVVKVDGVVVVVWVLDMLFDLGLVEQVEQVDSLFAHHRQHFVHRKGHKRHPFALERFDFAQHFNRRRQNSVRNVLCRHFCHFCHRRRRLSRTYWQTYQSESSSESHHSLAISFPIPVSFSNIFFWQKKNWFKCVGVCVVSRAFSKILAVNRQSLYSVTFAILFNTVARCWSTLELAGWPQ